MSFHSSTSSSSSSMHSFRLKPQTTTRIAKEVRDLILHPEDGIHLLVDEATGLPHSLHELTAEIEGPADTPYVGKYFLLRFTFSSDFPTTPPTAHFITKLYHPNVDGSTGAICVNTLKRDWKSSHTLKHCLAVIRCLLLEPFPESSLNEEAGKLFMESYHEYYKRTKLHADIHGRPQSIVPPSSTTTTTTTSNLSKAMTTIDNRNDHKMTSCPLDNTNHSSSDENNSHVETTNIQRGILKNTSTSNHHNSNSNNSSNISGSVTTTKLSSSSSSMNNKTNMMKKKSLKRL